MGPFTPEDVLGAVEDVGTRALLDSGAELAGVFRSDYHEDDLPGARVDALRCTFKIATSRVEDLGLRKGIGLTVEGDRFTIRRIENSTPGFSRLLLDGPA